MNDLEKYIRDHAAEFDTAEPAGGHEARFLARLDVTPIAAGTQPKESFRAKTRNLFRRPFAWALAVVACAVALLVLIIRPGDPLHGVSRSPEAIYVAYMDQVAGLYGALPGTDSARRDADLQAITEEADPLFAQLPEELGSRQPSRILKAYYGELLERASQINKQR